MSILLKVAAIVVFVIAALISVAGADPGVAPGALVALGLAGYVTSTLPFVK